MEKPDGSMENLLFVYRFGVVKSYDANKDYKGPKFFITK